MKKFLFIFVGITILFQGIFGFVSSAKAAPEAFSTNDSRGKTHTFSINVDDNGLVVEVIETTDGGYNRRNAGEKEGEDYWVYDSNLNQVKQQLTAYLISTEGQKDADQKREAIESKGGYAPPPPESCSLSLFTGKINLLGCAQLAANLLLQASSWILWLAGIIFNFTLGYSLNLALFVNSMPIINIGWTIFRDVANICFIFILLAIAIGTILQVESYNVKKLLVKVILVAILLNFSLFFTKIVIDASNILALQFYQKIIAEGQVPPTGDVVKDFINNADNGLSSAMVRGLGLPSIYGQGKSATDKGNNISGELLQQQSVTFGNLLIIGLAGSALILVTAFVFFAGTILFIVRTVVLVFVMILSPLAFLATALPQTSGFFSKWRDHLIKESFFAPLYLIMIWIVFAAIGGKYQSIDGKDMNFGTLLSGEKDSIGTLYTFIILIAFMIGSLIVAKSLSTQGGSVARKVLGGAMVSGSGWATRQTVGRFGKALGGSDLVNNLAAGRTRLGTAGIGLGKALRGTGNAAAKSSFDLRNAPGGLGGLAGGAGLGAGVGVGGFAKSREDAEKKKRDTKNAIEFERKKGAIQSKLKNGTDKEIEESLKGLSPSEFGKLGKDLLTNERVLKFASSAQRKAALDDKNDAIDPSTREQIKTNMYKDLNKAVVSGNPDNVKKALKRLSPDEVAELPESMLNNSAVYMHFDKDMREAIKKNTKITQGTQDEMVAERQRHLRDAIAVPAATRTAVEKDAIKASVKNLSGEDLYKEVGRAIATDNEIIGHLSEDQLKGLEKAGVTDAERRLIGMKIRDWRRIAGRNHPALKYVTSGGTTPTGGLISVGEGYNTWR